DDGNTCCSSKHITHFGNRRIEYSIEQEELTDKGIGQRQGHIGQRYHYQHDGQSRRFLRKSAQLRNLTGMELTLDQFHHDPHTDDVDTMVEHLDHYPLHSLTGSNEDGQTHQSHVRNGGISYKAFKIVLLHSDQ